jgi:CrcB protein
VRLNLLLAVAAGGALGSVARYLVGIGAAKWLSPGFPWGTLIVNVSGSFLIGVLAEAFALKWDASQATRAFLIVGLCGGFTTFSTFSLDFVVLVGRNAMLPALLYGLASVGLSIGGLYAGLLLARTLLH